MVLEILFVLLLGPPKQPARAVLSVSPHITNVMQAAREGIRATLTIEPDERNRVACLIWEGDNEAGNHCWEFNEIPFPRTTNFYVKLHTLGHYEFVLILQATDKRIQTASQSVEVY